MHRKFLDYFRLVLRAPGNRATIATALGSGRIFGWSLPVPVLPAIGAGADPGGLLRVIGDALKSGVWPNLRARPGAGNGAAAEARLGPRVPSAAASVLRRGCRARMRRSFQDSPQRRGAGPCSEGPVPGRAGKAGDDVGSAGRRSIRIVSIWLRAVSSGAHSPWPRWSDCPSASGARSWASSRGVRWCRIPMHP